jgi:hypothetical protein
MASNLTMGVPTATGVPAPPTELQSFGNNSASTKDGSLNYTSDVLLPTSPATTRILLREQYVKGQTQWPR